MARVAIDPIGILPFPASTTFDHFWGLWFFTIPLIVSELAWLALLLPPALRLTNWAPTRLRIARLFAAAFVCIAFLSEIIPFAVELGLFWFAR